MMTFNFTLTADLYQKMLNDIQAIFTINANSKNIYTAYMFLIFITAACMTFLVLGMGLSWDGKRNLFIAASILVISFPLGWMFNRKFISAYFDSMMNEYKNLFDIPQEVTVDESGISLIGKNGSSNQLWTGISNIYATRFFLVFIGEHLTFTIPNESIARNETTNFNEAIAAIEKMSGKKIIAINAVLAN